MQYFLTFCHFISEFPIRILCDASKKKYYCDVGLIFFSRNMKTVAKYMRNMKGRGFCKAATYNDVFLNDFRVFTHRLYKKRLKEEGENTGSAQPTLETFSLCLYMTAMITIFTGQIVPGIITIKANIASFQAIQVSQLS